MPVALTPRKQRHVFGVALYMQKRAVDYNLDPALAYIVGLLHDIGYIHGRVKHGMSGAEDLRKMGLNAEYVEAIRLHGVSPYHITNADADTDLLLAKPLVPFTEIDPSVRCNAMLTLLLEADLRVNADGVLVGFRERTQDIVKRYNDDRITENVVSSVSYVWEWCETNGILPPPTIKSIKTQKE